MSRGASLSAVLTVALVLTACGERPAAVQEVPVLARADSDARAASDLTRRAERFLLADAPSEAESLLREALTLDPTHPAARRGLALLLVRRGRPREAVPLLRAALVDTPVDEELLELLPAALEATGDHAGAEAAYRAWLEADGKHPDALAGLGRTLLRRGDVEGAVSVLQRAEKRNPTSVDVRCDLGLALAEMGRLGAAEKKFRDAVTRDAACVVGWRRLGDVILRADVSRSAEAAAAYRRVLELRPRDRDGLVALYGILRGAARAGDASAAEESEKRWNAIVRVFGPSQIGREERPSDRAAVTREARLRARLEADPADQDTRRTLAAQLRAEGVLDAAAAEYEILLDGGAATALDLAAAGATHLELGANDRAIALLARAVEAGAPPSVARQLAWALLVAGRPDESVAAYALAREAAPDDPAARDGAHLASLRR